MQGKWRQPHTRPVCARVKNKGLCITSPDTLPASTGSCSGNPHCRWHQTPCRPVVMVCLALGRRSSVTQNPPVLPGAVWLEFREVGFCLW